MVEYDKDGEVLRNNDNVIYKGKTYRIDKILGKGRISIVVDNDTSQWVDSNKVTKK